MLVSFSMFAYTSKVKKRSGLVRMGAKKMHCKNLVVPFENNFPTKWISFSELPFY